MGGQVLELESMGQSQSARTGLQASCLQADSLLWSLRGLKLAQDTFFEFEDESKTKKNSKHTQILKIIREQVRPLCNGTAPPSLASLVQQIPQIEARLGAITLPLCAADRTIAAICEKCELLPVEQDLLRFRTAWALNPLVPLVFEACFESTNVRTAIEIVSAVLRRQIEEVRAALSPSGFLSRSRLLTLDGGFESIPGMGLGDFLSMRIGLLQIIELANGDYERMVRTMALRIPDSGLRARDFSYLKSEWSLALGYLKGSLKGGHKGANILLHGLPGVGKTEFARSLVRAAGVDGFEIKSAYLDHRTLSPEVRRDNFSLACELLPGNRKTVIIFDDAEESLVCNRFSADRTHISRAAINRMLEENPIPTIWIVNETEDIDGAAMRRFDINIPFRRPPCSALRRQLENALPKQSVSDAWLRKVSASGDLTPAIVARLARINARMEPGSGTERVLDTSLETCNIRVADGVEVAFKREFCNTDPGIDAICRFLQKSTSSRLLMHGPTGTGKTALAKHLAETTDLLPLLVSPSSLLGAFVGETEQNIARLFKEAEPKEQLIILDEFESMAGDRKGAQRSWEISQVAEFLSRFDEYKGRVIACTNLIDKVDPAIRRRFHLKARVAALTDNQRIGLIREIAGNLKLKLPEDLHRLTNRLDGLAFGHLLNAAEVARYMDHMDWPKYLQLVKAELVGTEGEISRSIGFLQ